MTAVPAHEKNARVCVDGRVTRSSTRPANGMFGERHTCRCSYRGGRPRRITTDQRQRIVSVAGARPDHQGVALTRWSLPRLSIYLCDEGIVDVSARHLGALLAAAGLSFQRTRTWKASPDPDYEAKAARILALSATSPPDGLVISFDQMGPVSLRPIAGARWAPRGRPERQRADYNRRHGTRYVLAAYDVHADRLRVRLRPRRRGRDMLAFMRQIGACYPSRRRIYWIQDNLSANWTPDIRTFADDHNVELVPTPTYASYLNPVECHFSALTEFVAANADYLRGSFSVEARSVFSVEKACVCWANGFLERGRRVRERARERPERLERPQRRCVYESAWLMEVVTQARAWISAVLLVRPTGVLEVC
jgi:hypothetical protein